jgi:hypothetical protein
VSYAASNIKARLDRFVAARRPHREFTEFERQMRLNAILASNDNNPRHQRIREIVAAAKARAELA